MMRQLLVMLAMVAMATCAVMSNRGTVNRLDHWDLDYDVDNPCGGSISVQPDSSAVVRVNSAGKIKKAMCTLTFVLPPTNRCDKICASVVKFSKDENVVDLNISSGTEMTQKVTGVGRYCEKGIKLQVTIKQSEDYTNSVVSGGIPKYSLNFTVSGNCPGISSEGHEHNNKDSKKYDWDDGTEARKGNYIKGIVTGLCLALVFLIILLITYCYYKNSSFRGTRDYPAPKSGGFSTFKAKLTINKDEKKDHDGPKAEYRAKTSSPEHKPLLASAAAAATADVVVSDDTDKHDHHEETPQIVVSAHTSDGGHVSGGDTGGGCDSGGGDSGGGGCGGSDD